jgi:hypothetical protein
MSQPWASWKNTGSLKQPYEAEYCYDCSNHGEDTFPYLFTKIASCTSDLAKIMSLYRSTLFSAGEKTETAQRGDAEVAPPRISIVPPAPTISWV